MQTIKTNPLIRILRENTPTIKQYVLWFLVL
jgi:hypothetical protein